MRRGVEGGQTERERERESGGGGGQTRRKRGANRERDKDIMREGITESRRKSDMDRVFHVLFYTASVQLHVCVCGGGGGHRYIERVSATQRTVWTHVPFPRIFIFQRQQGIKGR